MPDRLLLIGNEDEIHIGAHLSHAAKKMNLNFKFLDVKEAYEGPVWLNKINWWLRGHRPTRLKEFSKKVYSACKTFGPKWMLAVGFAPLESEILQEIKHLGVECINYLTDDPWNSNHLTPWFMPSLPIYHHVFSVRHANLEDLKKIGCPQVSFLPFAYAPELHYPEEAASEEERKKFESDIVFIGGADSDRVPYMKALIQAGFQLALYGGYWERYPETRPYARGMANPRTMRLAIGGAKVSLCFVRRANRDGNSMRSFEIPAIGGCMLMADTEEHREIFGEEEKAVIYFESIEKMLTKTKFLLQHEPERKRLAQSAHDLIVQGEHTYKDRLISMLGQDGE